MPASKEQVGITVLVIAWIIVTWVQGGISITANTEAKKWKSDTGETDTAPSVWHASQWINGIAIAVSVIVAVVILFELYKNTQKKAPVTPLEAGSVLSGQSLTSWM